MNIAAITKFKHGDLFRLLRKLNWTQSDLAEKSGLSQNQVCSIINLRRKPTIEQANAIQLALGNAGEYLDILETWPELFQGFKKRPVVEQIKDVNDEDLISIETCKEALQIEAPSDQYNYELDDMYKVALGLSFNDRVKKMTELRCNGATLEAIGKEMKITREVVRQYLNKNYKHIRKKLRL